MEDGTDGPNEKEKSVKNRGETELCGRQSKNYVLSVCISVRISGV